MGRSRKINNHNVASGVQGKSIKYKKNDVISQRHRALDFILSIGDSVTLNIKSHRSSYNEHCSVTKVNTTDEGVVTSLDLCRINGRRQVYKNVSLDRITISKKRTYVMKQHTEDEKKKEISTIPQLSVSLPNTLTVSHISIYSKQCHLSGGMKRICQRFPLVSKSIDSGNIVKCCIPNFVKIQNFFTGGMKKSVENLDPFETTDVIIDFDSFMDTLLPTDLPVTSDKILKKLQKEPTGNSINCCEGYFDSESNSHFFMKDRQQYLRVGDMLTMEQIGRVFELLCNGNFFNLASVLLIGSQFNRNLGYIKVEQEKKKKETQKSNEVLLMNWLRFLQPCTISLVCMLLL